MKRLLLIDHHKTTQKVVKDLFSDQIVTVATDATSAIECANANTPDLVVLELSLAGHSGVEFLCEFRTYTDWRDIPIIVYTNVRLEPQVLRSKAWKQLNVCAYLYKPDVSLNLLKKTVEKHQTVAVA